jgi:sugar lactone lactonase YvrE
VSVTPLTHEALELGEGARWVNGRVVLVDILAGRLLEHPGTPGARLRQLARLDLALGAVAPVAGRPGHWLAAAGQGFALLDPAGGVDWLARPEERADGATRMNDGVADPAGRFWAGSMAYDGASPLGSLYRVDHDGTVHRVWDGLAIVNGPAFSADGRTMYLSDTSGGTVLRFEVDPAGRLGVPEPLWQAGEGEGSPDGLAVDDDDHVWVALWGGAEVRRLAPDGSTATRVPLPVAQPTSVCLAGDLLVVTSALIGLDAPGDDDGRLLAVDLPALGVTATAPAAAAYRQG